MSEIFKSALTASQITNLAADRANISKLRTNVAEIDTLIVNNAFNLPDGSLLINSSGTGEHLTTDPSGGVLTNDAFSLKTLTSSDASILITPSATEIDLVAVGGGGGGVTSVTPVSPPAPGAQTLIVTQVGGVTLKNVASGSPSISIGADADNVIITGPSLADAGVCDAPMTTNGAGPTFMIRGIDASTGVQVSTTANCVEIGTNLVAGTGITLTPAVLPATDITVTNAGVTSVDHTVAPIAGEGDIVSGPPATGAVQLKVLQPGAGITLDSSNPNYVKINNVGAGTTPTFTAGTGDEPLFDGSPLVTFTPTFKSLTAGTGISLASDANEITITNSASGVSSVDQTVAPGVNEATLIVGPPATGAVLLKNILGGTGVTVTVNPNDITLSAGAGGATLSEDATATGTGNLVAAPSPGATDFRVRAILAGSGMAVSTVGGDVLIDNIAAGQVYTLADDATGTVGPNTASVISAPTPTINDFRLKRIVGSSTATVTQAGGNVTLSVPASGMAALAQDSLLLDNVSDAGGLKFDNILIRVSDSANSKPPTINAATNTAASCVAIGNSASTTVGTGSVAIGNGANTAGFNSVAVGTTATTGASTGAVAVGQNSSAAGGICVAVGQLANAGGANSVAIGRSAASAGGSATAMGQSATASGGQATSIGALSNAVATGATALGYNCKANSDTSVAIGYSANVDVAALHAICIGDTVTAPAAAPLSVAIGYTAHAGSTAGVSVGNASTVNGASAVGVGNVSTAAGAQAVAVGSQASAAGAQAIAIGNTATASGGQAISIGNASDATFVNSMALGNGTQATADRAIVVGQGATSSGAQSTVFGAQSSATAQFGTSLGYNTDTTFQSAVAVGNNCAATAGRAITIGAATTGQIPNTESGACFISSSGGTVEALACLNNSFSLLGGSLLSNMNIRIFTSAANDTLPVASMMFGYTLYTNASTNIVTLNVPRVSVFTNAAMNCWTAGNTVGTIPGTGAFFVIDNRTGGLISLDGGSVFNFYNHASASTPGPVNLTTDTHLFFWQRSTSGADDYDIVHLGRINNTPL